MYNPVNLISNFIKTTPVESDLFKYTNLIPVIGVVVQLAKQLSLNNEYKKNDLKAHGVDKYINYRNASSIVSDMQKLNRINYQWQFADTLVLVSGVAIITLSPPAAFALVATGILLSVSRFVMAYKFSLSTARDLENHNKDGKLSNISFTTSLKMQERAKTRS